MAGVVGITTLRGARTVAEHVSRPDLLEPLRVLGVDDVQGYHVGPPRPLTDVLVPDHRPG